MNYNLKDESFRNVNLDQRMNKIKNDQFDSVVKAEDYIDIFIDKKVAKITSILNDIMPFLGNFSEDNDIQCLECCEKHLSKARAYYDESKNNNYRENIFLALGQLGLSESHTYKWEKLNEYIRIQRLEFQRTGGEPNWKFMLKVLDELVKTEKDNA